MRADVDLVRWLFDAVWSRGETDELQQRLNPHTFHYRDGTNQLGPAELTGIVENWRTALPDLEFRIVDLVADGDLVATRCRLTGSHLGLLRGREPTGHRVDMGVMMFFRFDESGLVETWELDDIAGLETQIDAP